MFLWVRWLRDMGKLRVRGKSNNGHGHQRVRG
jgi:hypothetical protein